MTRVLAVALTILTFGLLVTRAQTGAATVSGTVFAVAGGNLQNVTVIACLLENDGCSDSRSSVQAMTGGSSARYQLTNLEAGESYLMFAWKDINASGEADAGDELGVYTRSGKPALIEPPATGIDLRMTKFSGDLDALLAQADDNTTAAAAAPLPAPSPAPSSSGLTITGRVQPRAGGVLKDTVVIAGVFVNDDIDPKNSKAARVDASGAFSIVGLEKRRYGLFAWRDLDGDGSIGVKDEFGVYAPSGRIALVTPPISGVTLQIKSGGYADLDALRDLFLPTPAPTTSSGSVSSNVTAAGAALSYTIPKGWRSTGGGNYESEFGDERVSSGIGELDATIFAPRAKSGSLATQTRAIWQAETKGTLDFQGQKGAVFLRRTASGLNVGVTFGTIGSFENTGQPNNRAQLNIYTVLFVVETGAQVTPIFFKMTRAEQRYLYLTSEKDGRPQMLEFMQSVKSVKSVTVPPLYVEKDFIGKWKQTSGTYRATDWYNSSGLYSTTTYLQSAFTGLLTFKSGGTGQYFTQLTIVNTNNANTRTEDEPMKWRISGDQIIIDRLKSGYKNIYQIYARGTDAAGNPVFLTDYLPGNQTITDLDASPEDTWVVDK